MAANIHSKHPISSLVWPRRSHPWANMTSKRFEEFAAQAGLQVLCNTEAGLSFPLADVSEVVLYGALLNKNAVKYDMFYTRGPKS